MLYNALSVGKKSPKIAPSPWACVTPPEEDRATVIGNMNKKFGKDHACGSGDMLTDRQTHTETHTQTDIYTDMLNTILRRRSCGQSKYFEELFVSLSSSRALGTLTLMM